MSTHIGTVKVIVTPFEFDFEGCRVIVIGIRPYEWLDGTRRYFVSLRVRCGNHMSPIFHLDVKSNEELKEKLSVEIARFKAFIYSGKIDVIR